jgi:hypothetical protein
VGDRGPDFIGIGAQRAGTSWIYACLYEHPQICMPRKEINFFSRERNWSRGFGWYEAIFADCAAGAIAGEFSTSYLSHADAPARILARYPEVRLIVSLRHPVERAHSSYLNDIVAGAVPTTTSFAEALPSHPEYVDGSRYARHLERYLELFGRERVLVSVFDDARRDPLAAMRRLYGFLGADPAFRPSMLERPVGAGRVPRFRPVERALLDGARAFRTRRRLRPLWWAAKRMGAGDLLRALNTRRDGQAATRLQPAERAALLRELEPDVCAVERLLERDLPAWRE